MPLTRGRVRGFLSHIQALEPRIRFLAHGPPELTDRVLAKGNTGEKIDMPRKRLDIVLFVASPLRYLAREHQIAMHILNINHATVADDPDLHAVDSARPDMRRGPAVVERQHGTIIHFDDREGRILAAGRPEDVVC